MSNSSGARQLRSNPLLGKLWHLMEGLPTPEAEDSIWLRVLVQALVIVGIVATDIAAVDTQLSLWAVPLSIAGATWSWYRRRNRNIAMKFAIAIGMLVALAFFFQELFTQLNDTRLVLAKLLISLQVLHSFDLPRRKDLGYSMTIGLILLGVAGTLSETLAFGPVLLVFLALAIPTLVLDYRSRLNLIKAGNQQNFVNKHKQPNFKRFSFYFLLFLLTIGLGLGIFALLPRFPGYQLRTFPVSEAINIPADFDPRSINNPGYVRNSNNRNEGGSGSGAGELDDTFYYGFNTEINQNLRGKPMKPKVVMRVRSQAEGFWRVLGFDFYTGQGWRISRNDEVETRERPFWSYQYFLPSQPTANRIREVIQTYTIVSEMPNLIPVLFQPVQLFFPTPKIVLDAEGGLRSPVNLGEGITYTVISQVPYRNRSVLGKAGTKYPSYIRDYYLQMPDAKVSEKIRKRTLEILEEYNQQRISKGDKKLDNPYEITLYLAQYLKQRYNIKLDLPPLEEGEDLVEAFLFRYKGGYPDHFATVLTIMLRSIGIPARLVVGFETGEFNPFTGFYIVKNTDAHAMTEVFFPKYGWFAFNPIPGYDLIPPSIEDYEPFSVVKQFWRWVAGWLPSPLRSGFGAIYTAIASFIGIIIGWLWGLLARGWFGLFASLILAISLGFFVWLVWNQWRAWRYRRWLAKLPAMESIYQQMLAILKTQGFPKHPAFTPLEYAHQMRSHHSPPMAEVIEEISQAYVRWRYGGEEVNLNYLRNRLRELIPPRENLFNKLHSRLTSRLF